jgi:hypothetical protein
MSCTGWVRPAAADPAGAATAGATTQGATTQGATTTRTNPPCAALTIGLLVTVFGCAGEGANSGIRHIGEIGPDTASGIIRQVGNAPFTHTILDREEAIVITGPYEPEIRRLIGAEVRVTGRRVAGDFPGPTLEAMSYEILSVDGERPLLGTLELDEGGFLLTTPEGASVRLAAVSETLAESAGGRIWVILDANGGVAQYGILRGP